MVSPLITFQFWLRLDAAVRMLGDAAWVECHVTHKTGLHSTRCRLDKVQRGKKTPNPKRVWLLLLCSIVLSQLGWCWYRDLRFMNHPTPHSELFNMINKLGCDRKQVLCKQKTPQHWVEKCCWTVVFSKPKALLISKVLQVRVYIPHNSNESHIVCFLLMRFFFVACTVFEEYS